MELRDFESDVYTIVENILLSFPQDFTVEQVLHCVKQAHAVHYFLFSEDRKLRNC